MVIYLNQYQTARTAPAAVLKNGTYGEEVMQAGWNPTVVYLFRNVAQRALSPELPDDLSAVDADALLSRVYALATQI